MISQATLTSIAPTTTEASGSSTVQRPPSRTAPPIPSAEPTDDRASLRWCQALAFRAGESSSRPFLAVYWNSSSLARMDPSAAQRAICPGDASSSPPIHAASFIPPDTMMPMAAATSARLMNSEASVSNLP